MVIASAFCISFLIMGGLSLFCVDRLNIYIKYSDLMDHSGFVLEKVYDLEKNIRDIDRTERGYMLTEDTMYLRGMNKVIDSVPSNLTQLKELTADNSEIQKTIDSFRLIFVTRVAALRKNIAYVDTSTVTNVSDFYKDSRLLMLECSRLLKIIHQEESQLKRERLKEEQTYEQLTKRTIISLLVVFCIITLFLFALLIKELRDRMRYQEELQSKIIDLQRSHGELQEIAYVASHDLQEPLRKIQVFSDMLLYQKSEVIDSNFRANLKRINSSAGKMKSLIADLTSLTILTKIDETKKKINLNTTLEYLLIDKEDKIKERNATVKVEKLPVMLCYENQIRILLNELLDNALKFYKVDTELLITISSEITTGKELSEINAKQQNKKFQCIVFADNGIGFEKQFIYKMFRIFQRLHADESGYEGKGIGLAICQRIMANHDGYIVASGAPGQGATFKLFFPIN